jgi:hypothetical protein
VRIRAGGDQRWSSLPRPAEASSCMASRVPSLCRSVDRDWRGAAIDAGMAGSGRQMMKNLNSTWQGLICFEQR